MSFQVEDFHQTGFEFNLATESWLTEEATGIGLDPSRLSICRVFVLDAVRLSPASSFMAVFALATWLSRRRSEEYEILIGIAGRINALVRNFGENVGSRIRIY